MSNIDNWKRVHEGLKRINERYGSEVLGNVDMINGLLHDFANNASSEINIFYTAIKDDDIRTFLMRTDKVTADDMVAQIKQRRLVKSEADAKRVVEGIYLLNGRENPKFTPKPKPQPKPPAPTPPAPRTPQSHSGSSYRSTTQRSTSPAPSSRRRNNGVWPAVVGCVLFAFVLAFFVMVMAFDWYLSTWQFELVFVVTGSVAIAFLLLPRMRCRSTSEDVGVLIVLGLLCFAILNIIAYIMYSIA